MGEGKCLNCIGSICLTRNGSEMTFICTGQIGFKQNKALKWISLHIDQNSSFLAEKLESWGWVVLSSQLCSCNSWGNPSAKGLLCCHLLLYLQTGHTGSQIPLGTGKKEPLYFLKFSCSSIHLVVSSLGCFFFALGCS